MSRALCGGMSSPLHSALCTLRSAEIFCEPESCEREMRSPKSLITIARTEVLSYWGFRSARTEVLSYWDIHREKMGLEGGVSSLGVQCQNYGGGVVNFLGMMKSKCTISDLFPKFFWGYFARSYSLPVPSMGSCSLILHLHCVSVRFPPTFASQ